MNKNLLILFLSLTMFWSCSDDKIPVDADDNFITSVILTVDSKTYDATIENNVITVTVPYNVSLDGASASFVYTQSAEIYPNPQSITNWNEERVFRVVSYNGDERQYTYRVIKDEIREEGDVVLKTEAEIQAFGEKGTSVINGNLTIGTNDGEDITNLNGLENLKEVTGSITILDSYKGTDLTGLDNLKSIGGFTIGSSEQFSEIPLYLFSLNSIENITGDVNVFTNSLELVDFKSLPKVDGSVNIGSSSLKSITADKLEEVTGDFTVSCKTGNVSGGAITEFSIPAITTIGGTLSGSYFAELKTIYFPKLQIAGAIIFEELPFSVNNINFPDITYINGDLTFTSYTTYQYIGDITTGNTALKSFDGFGNLRKLTGTMTLTAFTEADNTPNVSNATIGNIYLERMESLAVLDLSNSQFIAPDGSEESRVKFSWMPIGKITGSKTMNCSFLFENCDLYTYDGLPKFENIESVVGLYVGQAYKQNYSNFVLSSDLKRIQKYLQIDLCTTSTDTTVDMPDLTEVGDYVYISAVPDGIMFSINMPSLVSTGGQFYVGAYGIKDFDLSSLKEVSTSITSTKLAVDVLFDMEKDFELGYGLNLCFRRGTDISLNSLEKVGGKGMSIYTPYRKTESLSFPNLQSVSCELKLLGSSSTTLSDIAFSNLTSCPKITISTFKNLTDFSTFGTLFTNGQISNTSDWSVSGCAYNPTYEDMKAGKYTPTSTTAQAKLNTSSKNTTRKRTN